MEKPINWQFRARDYDAERSTANMERHATKDHPLRGTVTMSSNRSTKSVSSKPVENEILDPLSMFATATFDGVDPLSQSISSTAKLEAREAKVQSSSGNNYLDDSFEPWDSRRTEILTKYTTSEKLSITTSFLSSSDKEKILVKQQSASSDKMKTRLEQLDDFEEGSIKETLNLSQQEYVSRIDELNQTLLNAWNNEQRVKALKIAIQCAKLLGDISVLPFFPSKFVLVTDILDNFGTLVYERIKNKAMIPKHGGNGMEPLPDNFTPDQVPDSAKETCRNWFYKVASIRELIPRLFVEMAILRCYAFLTQGEYSDALMRLTYQTRGIGDPLVAVYARAYLCRVGTVVAPHVKNHLVPSFHDCIRAYKQIESDAVQNTLAKQGVEMSSYLQLFCPALDWVLQCVSYKATEIALLEILDDCKSCKSSLVLNSVMCAFDPKFISSRALQFHGLVKDSEDLGFPKYLLYKSLGISVVQVEPSEDDRLLLLNEVWKVVMKLKDPHQYIACAEVWIEFPVKYFTAHEVNTLLGNIIKHMLVDRTFEKFYDQLLSILSKIVSNLTEFSVLFTMDKFLPFMDMFQKESMKVDACKIVMNGYTRTETGQTQDPLVIDTLMSLCKTMHDSVNSLSLTDERRSVGMLISKFLLKVDYGRNFEQQLDFYVKSRANFTNLDSVLVMLVQNVNFLAMETKRLVKGNHTKKTAAFIRACMAFSFITIPSMMDVFIQLKLYRVSGEVALANQAIGQADGFFRAAVHLLPNIPKTIEVDFKMRNSEQYLIEFVNSLMSSLLVVPDHPDHGSLYLFRGLLNVIQSFPWDEHSDGKSRVYLNAIALLSAAGQDSYIYRIAKVDSNDKMYGSDAKFIAELRSMCSMLIKEILDDIQEFDSKDKKRQAFLCVALFNRLIAHGDLNSGSLTALAGKLWSIVKKNGQADSKVLASITKYIVRRSSHEKTWTSLANAIKSNS